MIENALLELLAREFGHTFTPDQQRAAELLSRFAVAPQPKSAFILRGFAGTGKTSLVAALVRVMGQLKRRVALLAPTGRAAKVFAAYAGAEAFTIHKTIYRQQTFNGENTRFSLGFNKHPHTLFIVDEASMLSNQQAGISLFGTGQLLDDLVSYVYRTEGCRLLLVGDTAQLPPVGEAVSPALQRPTLENYGLTVVEADLKEVVRQAEGSDVLSGATHLRTLLAEGAGLMPKISAGRGDVRFVPGQELVEELDTAYRDCGEAETIVVTRSNKRANVYNFGIRSRIFDRDEELVRGDRVMAVKNNYYWAEQLLQKGGAGKPPFDFVANGDTAEVVDVFNRQEQYGFRFADAVLRFPDYGGYELECRVLLDTLTSESPSLTSDEQTRLFQGVQEDYMHIASKKERMKAIRKDQFYNALQIKYAYAVTCHKAQGGQWERVFVDQGYLPPDMDKAAYLRWLYTAFTRTTRQLYLVNWPDSQRADS